jgi:hypothetical protein
MELNLETVIPLLRFCQPIISKIGVFWMDMSAVENFDQ